MYKRIIKYFLLLLALFLGACSITRKGPGANGNTSTGFNYKDFFKEVESYNVGNEGFSIKRGRIETSGLPVNGEFNYSLKVNAKGDFLFSVKGPLSMEFVRVIAVDDDAFLINRLEKVIYQGSKSELMRRFGLPDDIVKLTVGDIIPLFTGIEEYVVEDEVVRLELKTQKERGSVLIDKNERKLSAITILEENGSELILIKYDRFKSVEEGKYPSIIHATMSGTKADVVLYIDDIESGCSEQIEIKLPDYQKKRL